MPQERFNFLDSFGRVAPDLIVGLLGIPIAIAFQDISSDIIDLVKIDKLATLRGVAYVLVIFFYLSSVYLILSFLIINTVQEGVPEHLHSRQSRYIFWACLLLGAILTGLFAAAAKEVSISAPLRILTFLPLGVAIGMDGRLYSRRSAIRYRMRQSHRATYFMVLFGVFILSQLLWMQLIDDLWSY